METRKLEKRKSANFGQMECRRDFVAKEDNWRFGLARKFLKIERTAWKRTRQVVAGRSFQLTGQTRTFTIIIPRLLAVESVHTFLHGIISFDFVAILILLSLLFPSFLFFRVSRRVNGYQKFVSIGNIDMREKETRKT